MIIERGTIVERGMIVERGVVDQGMIEAAR
jgi:hypothetical protein